MSEQGELQSAQIQETLILMGIKHCGKSTQGRLLAKHFSCPFYDTDDIIREMTGKLPREIYTRNGENAFIEAEAKACAHLAEKLQNRAAIVATGGGICKNQKALELLLSLGTLIFLNAPEKTACDRIVREVKIAPDGALKNLPAYIAKEHPQTLDDVRASFHRFYEERTKTYRAICSVQVAMTPASPEENMRAILESLSAQTRQ